MEKSSKYNDMPKKVTSSTDINHYKKTEAITKSKINP